MSSSLTLLLWICLAFHFALAVRAIPYTKVSDVRKYGAVGNGKIDCSKHVTTNMVQLLIAGSQAGCLIGKSGQNIEKLRNCSGATISIMPKTQLPQCASAHEWYVTTEQWEAHELL